MAYIILLGAGKSSRMGGTIPKPLQLLAGKPILQYSLEVFSNIATEVLIVTPPEYVAEFASISHMVPVKSQCIPGGQTRFESMTKALIHVPEDAHLLIHDAARPFITEQLIHDLLLKLETVPAVIPALPAKEALKHMATTGEVHHSLPREHIMVAQTPQAFRCKEFKQAVTLAQNNPLLEAEKIFDDSYLMELAHFKVAAITGNEQNLKITTPLDLKIAHTFL